jgi:hypothetical protein
MWGQKSQVTYRANVWSARLGGVVGVLMAFFIVIGN